MLLSNPEARHGKETDDTFVRVYFLIISIGLRVHSLTHAGLNFTGFVWTVDQETHHTVTVEFYDVELHRNFHFTDPYRYDKACLSESHCSIFAETAVLIALR
jgi:hypothetical protein